MGSISYHFVWMSSDALWWCRLCLWWRKSFVLDFPSSLVETKNRELQLIDQRLSSALEQEQAARRESEQRLIKQFEEKASVLREDMIKEGKIRNESEQSLRRYLEIDIPKL